MRAVVVGALVTALVVACNIDATDGIGPSSGGSGGNGATCQCANSANECDGTTGGCNAGLMCTKSPNGSRQVCAPRCPCLPGFACRAAGFVGGTLFCFAGN